MLIRLKDIYKDKGFSLFLISVIQERVITEINPQKMIKLGEYLNKVSIFKKLTYRYISPREILLSAVYNLQTYSTSEEIVIEVDRSVPFYDSTIKLYQLVDFITYGNLAIKGYPLLDEIFKDITENINVYFRLYIGTKKNVS